MDSPEIQPQKTSLLLKIPGIRWVASHVLHGRDIVPGGPEDKRYLYWNSGDKQVTLFAPDQALGLDRTHAISFEEERAQLIKANDGQLTTLQKDVEKEEQAYEEERKKNEKWLSVRSLAFIGLAIAFIFYPPLNRFPGEAIGWVGRQVHAGESQAQGEDMVYESLSFGPEALIAPNGKGFLNTIDYYKENPDSGNAKDFQMEIPGIKQAIQAMINQDFPAMQQALKEGKINPSQLSSYMNFADGKPKEMKTLINYYKSIAEKNGQKEDAKYWEDLEKRLTELLK